jgi:hypothetical protein
MTDTVGFIGLGKVSAPTNLEISGRFNDASSHLTRRWRKPDSNSQSHLSEKPFRGR